MDVASRNTLKTLDPRIGKVVANVAEGDVEYINRAFLAARKTFDEGPCPRMTPYVKFRISLRFVDLLKT